MRASAKTKEYFKLIVASVIIGLLCAFLGDSLKRITAYYEDIFSDKAAKYRVFYIIFPVMSLSLIHLLRRYLFDKKENKGIKEIYETLKTRHNELPAYKIPSHYINGFLTVIFGGSTGVEVSTVVASATIGGVVQNKANIHTAFRKELIYAGIAAGITVLFNSPLAGILFSIEVISKRISRNAVISILIAILTAFAFNWLVHDKSLFTFTVSKWNYYAIPYFILLAILSGVSAVYLTRTVLFFKKTFSRFPNYATKILISASILSIVLLLCPQLYGDGYGSMREIFETSAQHINFSYSLLLLTIAILLLKPIVTSATLAAGGDGGVFAPGLFMGAFLGLLVAIIVKQYMHIDIVPINCMVIGMAAVLSGSLHAPFTSACLVCALAGNYILLVPILVACLIAKMIAKLIYPYTVYTYAS
jgi:CIC family chloride channel protein